MKKLHILLLSTLMCVGLSACSTGGNNTSSGDNVYNPFASKDESSDDSEKTQDSNKSSSKSDENLIEIEDIDWKVEKGIYDDRRDLMFSYTNNSNYDILDFSIDFVLKPDLSDDEIKLLKKIKGLDDQTNEDFRKIEVEAPSVGYKNILTETGTKLSPQPCWIYGKHTLSEEETIELGLYDLMVPDVANIKYISEDKIYDVYYDFKNDSYTEKEVTKAFSWSEKKLASLLPKPDLEVGVIDTDYENYYNFEGYGVDDLFFNDYVNKCKEKGFTVDPASNTDYYYADNADGYNARVDYDKKSKSISISITEPEEQK